MKGVPRSPVGLTVKCGWGSQERCHDSGHKDLSRGFSYLRGNGSEYKTGVTSLWDLGQAPWRDWGSYTTDLECWGNPISRKGKNGPGRVGTVRMWDWIGMNDQNIGPLFHLRLEPRNIPFPETRQKGVSYPTYGRELSLSTQWRRPRFPSLVRLLSFRNPRGWICKGTTNGARTQTDWPHDWTHSTWTEPTHMSVETSNQ